MREQPYGPNLWLLEPFFPDDGMDSGRQGSLLQKLHEWKTISIESYQGPPRLSLRRTKPIFRLIYKLRRNWANGGRLEERGEGRGETWYLALPLTNVFTSETLSIGQKETQTLKRLSETRLAPAAGLWRSSNSLSFLAVSLRSPSGWLLHAFFHAVSPPNPVFHLVSLERSETHTLLKVWLSHYILLNMLLFTPKSTFPLRHSALYSYLYSTWLSLAFNSWLHNSLPWSLSAEPPHWL